MNIWEIDKLFLFIMFVIPGFVSLKAYELMFPSQIKDSSKQIIDAVTYSCINYAFLFFIILKVENSLLKVVHENFYLLFYFFVMFISPILIVFFWKWVRQTDFALKNAPHPTLKPWDFVFMQRKPYWVKVTLKDGNVVGGIYSGKSFVSSSPAKEQLYLEESWIINDKGGFERAKNNSAGIIIISDEILYVELRKYGE
ncbi:MAG: hypothetical protein HRT38_16215 [Alteromonadaceae bacterium]|nr:hypothetical protein [Alteromonadaceae bacterium]